MQEDKLKNVPGGVVETVRFRLKAGVSAADFSNMAQEGAGVLATLPGFRHRLLARQDDSWQDVIQWRSMAEAEAAMAVVMVHPAFAGFMAAIDPDTIEMSHRSLHLTMAA